MILTYNEVIALALKHYNNGGDGTYECLSKADYDRDIAEDNGDMYTESALLRSFGIFEEIRNEHIAMGEW